jgi:uncharacterized protein YjiS (DUF1127 family)
MSATITHLHAASRSHGGVSLLRELVAWAFREIRLRRSMRELSSFDDAMLRDVGLDRSAVEDAVRHGRPWAARRGDPGRADAPTIVHPTSLTEWR